MLKSLTVQNFALIREMTFYPESGLNVITGETGAGKSIMLGALGLVLGNRADSSVIYDETGKCIVEAVFLSGSENTERYIRENNLDNSDEIIMRREVTSNGKSRAFINDTPVGLSQLKELGRMLIEIHTQNTNLLIRENSVQLELLDDFAQNQNILEAHQNNWNAYQAQKVRIEELREQLRLSNLEKDFLEFQYQELENLKPVEGEDVQLEEKANLLNHALEINENIHRVLNDLLDSENSVYQRLNTSRNLVKSISHYKPEFMESMERIESIMVEIKEIAGSLAPFADLSEGDPQELEQVNLRLSAIQQILRKHNLETVEELVQFHNQVRQKLSLVAHSDSELEKEEKLLENYRTACLDSASGLHKIRVGAAGTFSGKVLAVLKAMGMPRAGLEIKCTFNPENLNSTGATEIQILFNADGNAVFPLEKIASGGEVSRLNFCFKSILAKKKNLPTIVFDEADSGVSGEVALKFGELMKSMAEGHQIIGITHLPQVAAQGTHQFLVYKEADNGTAVTKLKKLSETERVDHIATMLSGRDPGDAALANAQELLGLN